MKIVFLDTVGLTYNGDTLKTKGLGGSESAVILLSKELVKVGFDVSVYCNTDKEGVYDGVIYKNITRVNEHNTHYDVLISSRSVLPFVPEMLYEEVMSNYNFDVSYYNTLVRMAGHKVLWMHDTFCSGDEYMQDILADGYFDEIFNLSDWHKTYTSTVHQEEHITRYPEFFKSKIFNTRNGMVNHGEPAVIEQKDRNSFVYNASLPKGMIPLLTEVWPEVKKYLPEAKLTIIGGYYDINSVEPDEFELRYRELKDMYESEEIVFTGIIKQSDIAEILKDSMFFIFPNIYPETFGISTTEAINYNCVPITYNFGALEEIGLDGCTYQTEFHYNSSQYANELFINSILEACHDSYRTQQKQYKCNILKGFEGWDVVALQWKHHIYKVTGNFLPLKDTIKHRYNMGNIYKMYRKEFVNPDEYIEDYSIFDKRDILVVTPVYNAEKYISGCIQSVASQVYNNYHMVIIDDVSTDNTVSVARETIEALDNDLKHKFTIIKNDTKKYAVGNQVEFLNNNLRGASDTIIILLDGDDTLVNDYDIFNYINREYVMNNIKFTYGSCHSIADNIDLIAQPYSLKTRQDRTYRDETFTWGMPYTHLRTFSSKLFNSVDKSNFMDENGEYWKAGGDNAMFYPMIEKCEPDEVKCVQRVLVMYNDLNPINDYKVNADEQNMTKINILNKD